MVFLFTHVFACVFAFVALLESHAGQPTWADSELQTEECSCRSFYWMMFYFSAYTVTSIGHGDIVPVSNTERAIDSVVMIFSQMFIAKNFADLTFLISTRNYWQAQRQRRVTQTSAALTSMNAPMTLRKRVLCYQDFIWEIRTERRSQECLQDLSETLLFEIKTVMYHELVIQAAFLRCLSSDALQQIIKALTDFHYLPSDFLVRRGEDGSDMYFLREGAAGIFITHSPPHWHDPDIKVLTRGDYFGEVGLLTGQKRSAWVMARTFCVSSMLPKRAIDEVVEKDPGCMALLSKSMQDALKLQASVTWEKVAEDMFKKFDDLGEIWDYIVGQEDTDFEANLLSWKRYQALMSTIKVSVLDQKLLWIDIDKEKAGSADFKDFVDVCFGGKLTAEAEALEAYELGDGEYGCSEYQFESSEDPQATASIPVIAPRDHGSMNSAPFSSSVSDGSESPTARDKRFSDSSRTSSKMLPSEGSESPSRAIRACASPAQLLPASRQFMRQSTGGASLSRGATLSRLPSMHSVAADAREAILEKLDGIAEQLTGEIQRKVAHLDARIDSLAERRHAHAKSVS